MKRIVVIFIAFLFCFSIFAEDILSDTFTTVKEITAYKELESSGSTTAEVTLKILNPESTEVSDGSDINIPEANRGTSFSAFTWELSGNLYTKITLSFKFGPMYLGELSRFGDQQVTENDKIIPYSVTIAHTSTKVANTSVGTTKLTSFSSNSNTMKTYARTGQTTLYFNYADSINVTGISGYVTLSARQATVEYNMSTNSLVRYKSGSRYYEYTDVVNTCHDWKRTGSASVTLNLNADGSRRDDSSINLGDGTYRANVIVEISTV